MAFKKIAAVGELPEGSGKQVTADGKELALFHVGGKFYCIDNKCTHRGGPLGNGPVEGNVVTCPWHGSKFDVTTGEVRAPPAKNGVKTYKTKVEGKDVLADI